MKRILSFILFAICSITSLAQTNVGLVGYYKLDDAPYGPTRQMLDQIEPGAHGLSLNLLSAQNKYGESDRAVYFYDDLSIIRSTVNSDKYHFTGAFSIAFWIKLDETLSVDEERNIFSNGVNGLRISVVNTGSNLQYRLYISNLLQNSIIVTQVESTEWHHITFTFNGDLTSVGYLNGEQVNLSNAGMQLPGRIYASTAYFGDNEGSNTVHMYLDEIRIYDRQLFSAEVSYLSYDPLRAVLGDDITICPNAAFPILKNLVDQDYPDNIYKWEKKGEGVVSNAKEFTPSSPGIYYFTITNANIDPRVIRDTIQVSINNISAAFTAEVIEPQNLKIRLNNLSAPSSCSNISHYEYDIAGTIVPGGTCRPYGGDGPFCDPVEYSFSTPGTYPITLTIFDEFNNSFQVSRSVYVSRDIIEDGLVAFYKFDSPSIGKDEVNTEIFPAAHGGAVGVKDTLSYFKEDNKAIYIYNEQGLAPAESYIEIQDLGNKFSNLNEETTFSFYINPNQQSGTIGPVGYIYFDGVTRVINYGAIHHADPTNEVRFSHGGLDAKVYVPIGYWTYVTFVYRYTDSQHTQAELIAYANGLPADKVSGAAVISTSFYTPNFGRNVQATVDSGSPSEEFGLKGSLDEFKIYNKALSREQVRQTFDEAYDQMPKGLIAHYKFDKDNIGKDEINTSMLPASNGASIVTSVANFRDEADKAIFFNNSSWETADNYVNIEDVSQKIKTIRTYNGCTFSFFAKIEKQPALSDNSFSYIFFNGYSSISVSTPDTVNNAHIRFSINGDQVMIEGPLSEWRHYSFTYNIENGNPVYRGYIDGVLVKEKVSDTISFSSVTASNNTIGHAQSYFDQNSFSFKGSLDEFQIYNIGLSEAQVLSAYNLVLPVKLRYFTAAAINEGAVLSWSVEQEDNFSHYEIEKSDDGVHFYYLDKVNRGQSSYLYKDNFSPKQEYYYYRLKMVDIDGAFEYSNIAKAAFNKDDKVKIKPNPANTTITISGVNPQSTIEVYNLAGVKVLRRTLDGRQINIQHLKKGVYFVSIIQKESKTVRKLIVQ